MGIGAGSGAGSQFWFQFWFGFFFKKFKWVVRVPTNGPSENLNRTNEKVKTEERTRVATCDLGERLKFNKG
jgi:hypothetical protein